MNKSTHPRRLVSQGCLGLAAALALTAGGAAAAEARDGSHAKKAYVQRKQAAREASASTAGEAQIVIAPEAVATKAPWVPHVSDTWQWQLMGKINTSYNVTVYDVDLFDAPDADLATLRNQGKFVVCYFSAGSSEDWRPDYKQFKASDKGNKLDPKWEGENWLDTRSANVRNIMKARLDKAKSRGCDGVEPDNVDGYSNNPGFNGALNKTTQLDYNRFLANEAHARGLKVALKNDVAQLKDLEPSFDFAVNEECHDPNYNECGGYTVFTSKGKPVFNAEYKKLWRDDANARAKMCAKARSENIRTLVLPIDLNDKFRYSCD